MICKNCGVESRDLFCPHCGNPLYDGLTMNATLPVPVPSPTPPVPAPAPAPAPKDEEAPDSVAAAKPADKTDAEPKKESTPTLRRPPLRFSMIFWQAMALLLPVAYFFFDAFAVISDRLFASAPTGRTYLADLIERLTNPAYTGNALSEISEATLGETVPLTQSVSLASLMSGEELAAGFLVPFIILLSFTALSALCAVFLLITGGRILRWRPFCSLTLFGGTGAAFAPLLGLLALRVSNAVSHGIGGADTALQRIVPSVEHLCIMGILLCALLPATASIKELAAYARRQNGFLTAPFGSLEKRSFGFKKAFTLLTVLLIAPLLAASFFLEISPMGSLSIDLIPSGFIDLYHTLMDAKSAADAGEALQHLSLAHTLLGAALPIATAVTLLCGLLLTLGFLRVLFIGKAERARKKGAKRVLKSLETNARGGILAPYVSFVVLQILAIGFLLVFSPMVAHLSLSNVEDTVSLLYLTIAYVRAVSGTGTLYAFVAAGGAILWFIAGRFSDALWLSERKKLGKKKPKKKKEE